jgi:transcriptional regulator with XRE-family HTH domain
MATPHAAESAGEALDAGLKAALGVAMRACRARISISQKAAARRAGVKTEVWRELERGELEASLPLLTRIALALELTLGAFAAEVHSYLVQGAPLLSSRGTPAQETPDPWERAQKRGERRTRIGRAVRDARAQNEMSVEDLAGAANAEPFDVSVLEGGVIDADHDVLARVGRALDRPIWDLVDEAT